MSTLISIEQIKSNHSAYIFILNKLEMYIGKIINFDFDLTKIFKLLTRRSMLWFV